MRSRRNALVFVAALLALVLVAGLAAARDLWVGERNVATIYGRVTDEKGKPVIARVELWYAELGPVTKELGQELPPSEQYQRNLFHVDFSNEEGWYNLKAIPGEWLVRVSKGPEHEMKEMLVTVPAGDRSSKRYDWQINQLYDLSSRGWFAGDMHLHSLHSDGRQTPAEVFHAMVANDMDFAPLTDHNQIAGNEEWRTLTLMNGHRFLPIPGFEVTTTATPEQTARGKGWGHMNVIGVDKLVCATDPDHPDFFSRFRFSEWTDVQRCIDETHAEGGLYLMTHSLWPMDWPDGTISTWGQVRGFDAIDVFIGWDLGPHMPTIMASEYGPGIFGTAQFNLNTLATQAWFEFLNAGNRVAAWASSDSHDAYSLQHTGIGAPVFWRNTVGNARVYVKSEALHHGSVMRALKEGNAFVTSGAWGPLLLVESGGKGPGDIIRPRSDGMVPLKITVLSNRPLKRYPDGIRIIQDGQVIKTLPTPEGALTMTVETAVRVSNGRDTWLVVEVFGDWPAMAMTNALYVDAAAPYGVWGSPQWSYPAGADRWMNPFPNVPAVTVPDGPSQSPIPLAPVVPGVYRKTY